MIEAMAGRPAGTMPEGIGGISIDSRSLGAGDAFFAIKGDRVDGHDYANVAAANGEGLPSLEEPVGVVQPNDLRGLHVADDGVTGVTMARPARSSGASEAERAASGPTARSQPFAPV